ncbi:hypothetical protein L195_g049553, partial [Trifolium pratense]
MPTVDSILKCIQVVVYGYSVVLFKLLTAKHIHERWQQNSQETHSQFGVIVDHNVCEKATLFNIGLASKTIIIFIDLEDKIIFRRVGSDIINALLIPCLFSNILCNEETIGDMRVVEVEMMERIRLKKMLLSSWSNALEVEVISMEPFEVDNLNSQFFFTQYHDYCISSVVWIGPPWPFNFLLMLVVSTSQQFLASESVIATDLNQIVQWRQGIDINDPRQSLLLLCVLLFMRIRATLSLKLGQDICSFYGVFAHVDQVRRDDDLNDICININFLTEVEKTSIWTNYDQFPISCAHFKQWDSGQHLDMYASTKPSQFKQWDP